MQSQLAVRHPGMLTLTTTALGGGVLSVAFAPALFVPACPNRHCGLMSAAYHSKVMNVCGVGLGCVMLMTGALLAYVGMDALMDMPIA